MKDDDPDCLDEKQVAQFVEKLRAISLKDTSMAKDVLEVLEASFQQDVKEAPIEIARTICEILEPERLGGIVWLTCKLCKSKLDAQEIESKVDTCFSCRVSGFSPLPDNTCW